MHNNYSKLNVGEIMKRIVFISILVGVGCGKIALAGSGGSAFAGGLAGGTLGGIFGSAITQKSSEGSSSASSSMYSEMDRLRYEFNNRLEQLSREIRELKENSGGGISAALLRRVTRLEDQIKDSSDDSAQDPLLHRDVDALKRDLAQVKRVLTERVSDLEQRVDDMSDSGMRRKKTKQSRKFEKQELSVADQQEERVDEQPARIPAAA